MKEHFLNNLKYKRDKIEKRWYAVKENCSNYDEWKRGFFSIFGSIGDALLASMKFNVITGSITREFAVVLMPNKIDISKFEYVLIYVMYEKSKVDGLFDYKDNYKEINRYELGFENKVWEDINKIIIREPDMIS